MRQTIGIAARGERGPQAWIDRPAGLLLGTGFLRRRAARLDESPADQLGQPLVGQAPGHDVDHILLLGAGSGQGWGATASSLELSAGLAAAISSGTGRGCQVEIVASPAVKLAGIVAMLDGRPLESFDAVILAAGLNEAIGWVSVSRWDAGLRRLVELLSARTAVSSEIVVLGIPPIRAIATFDSALGGVAERHAQVLDQITQAICTHTERTSYLPMEPDRDHRASTLGEANWITRVADAVSHRLALHYDIDGDRRRPRPSNGDLRTRLTINGIPVAETPMADTETATALAEIVDLTHRAFRIENPTVSMIQSRRGLPILRIGSEPLTWLGEASWHEFALGAASPLVVSDTRDDERFRDDPLVLGPPHFRFFAVIPIDAPEGGRLGAICVFDSSPRRRADDIDPEQLPKLAETVTREFSRIFSGGS